MNKKSRYAVAIGLLIVIAAGFTLFNSQSNITAGSTCETKGLTKSNSGTEFICELNSEKLVWIDKSNTPVYAIGPGSRMVYQFVDKKLQRLNQFEVWQDKDGRAESDFNPIRVAAYKSISSLAMDESHKNKTTIQSPKSKNHKNIRKPNQRFMLQNNNDAINDSYN